jgi:hypothetical protein
LPSSLALWGQPLLSCTFCTSYSYFWAHSHKGSSTPKKGLEEGLRRCWSAAKSTCCSCPSSYKLFPPTPCFVHRVHAKLLVRIWRWDTIVPSFMCTSVPSLLRRGSDPLAKLAAATPKDSTYRLWPQFILGGDPVQCKILHASFYSPSSSYKIYAGRFKTCNIYIIEKALNVRV